MDRLSTRRHIFLASLASSLLGLLLLVPVCVQTQGLAKTQFRVLALDLKGAITPAKSELLSEAVQEASDYDLLLIRLNTPGGLGASMREMVQEILNSPIPVLTWVGPRGARAASAGLFLVAASHVAAMAPQTTIGAASPVGLGGKDLNSTMGQKVKNDFLGLVRGMAASRGRNIEWYEQAVEQAATLTAKEAYEKKVIDYLAQDPQEALVQAGKTGIAFGSEQIRFSEAQIQSTTFEIPLRYRFLAWLLHPQIAYFLLLGGIAGLFFELSHPGAIFPGVFGSICLLLALYALAILPTNIAGVLLMLLAFVLFILELAVTSFGLLTIGGLVCLFFGSTLLFRTANGLFTLGLPVVLPTSMLMAAFVIAVLFLVTRAQIRPRQTGQQAMLGLRGRVTTASGAVGKVKVRGELWNAHLGSGQGLKPGMDVEVVGAKGLDLEVKPLAEPKDQEHDHD